MCLIVGCGGSSTTGNQGLYINAALGVTLIQSPIPTGIDAEGPVDAFVVITRETAEGAQVQATLTVNGVEVPQGLIGYDFAKVSIPGAAAGGTLVMHAALGGDSAELTLACPPEVTITAPADHLAVAVGDSVTVAWNGAVDHATSIKPDIMVRGFDPATGSRTSLGFADRIETGKSSDLFALPDPHGAPQWLVDLYVPGDLVDNAQGVGHCMLDRRVHLVPR